MCGIAGILSFNNFKLPFENIQYMTKAMSRRGPDDEGFAFFHGSTSEVDILGGQDTPKSVFNLNFRFSPQIKLTERVPKNTHLALGHRRLSILDLSPAGHQPMCTEDGRYWIVHNGEIYNYNEIKKELESAGEYFTSDTDTEVILKSYRLWRAECLHKFNGMWAFAIWDNKEKTLFCARDRIGIKPFYYTIQDGQFIFGSDIKTIIASDLYRPEPDMEGLYLAMAFGMAPRPKTAFKDLVALEQAHWMHVHLNGEIQKQRYWSVPIGTQKVNMSEEEAINLLEEQLIASVKRRLLADVPVGTFMSGGIDSTTISAIASELQPGIKAFTLAYENTAPELNEVQQAMATAAMHPMEHIVHRVDPAGLYDLQSRIDGYEEPYHGLAANYVISKLVRDNDVKVVLNGLGGDELFAGYSWYSHVEKWKLARSLKSFIDMIPPFSGRRWNRLLSLSRVSSADRLHTILFAKSNDTELHELFSDPDLQEMNTPEVVHDMYADGLNFTDDIEAISYMDIMNYIGNHHLHRSDQFTMAHSIEGRFPFLDHKLVEVAFRIPSQLKKHGRLQKYALRKVAEKYIAPECLSMKKKGFGLPLKQWLSGPLKSLLEDKLKRLEMRNEIRDGVPNKWFREYQACKRSPNQIWHLAALEMWFETFIDK